MTEATLAKVAWLAIVLTGVVLVAIVGREPAPPMASAGTLGAGETVRVISLPNGQRGVADAGGHIVLLRDYRRIASGSVVADEILLALAEPERVVALTHYGRESVDRGFEYGARLEIQSAADVELLRKHRVDLLILNHFGAPAELARLRDAGIEVFNLGEMRGIATLRSNIETVSLLLGDRARGLRLAENFQRRMRAVAADVPRERRKRALYVSAYGGQLFGGAARTSYHDVLTAAGLIDVAAVSFSDWPHYDPEQVFALDPDVVVTTDASVEILCRTSGLDQLRACKTPGAVVGLPGLSMEDPGLGMLEAAEQIRDRVYGPMQ
jgi:ABC-type Fe3+-hydroxamate transport system substrate-binding protein